jgi:hypothetical protein
VKTREGKNGGRIKVWEKGEPSPNPSGRPKKLPSLDKLLPEVLGDELDDHSKIKQILDKLTDLAIKKGDTRAAQILLDRGYGAAKQQMTVDQEIVVTIKRES